MPPSPDQDQPRQLPHFTVPPADPRLVPDAQPLPGQPAQPTAAGPQLIQPTQPMVQPGQTAVPGQFPAAPAPGQPHPAYDFILNPDQPAPRSGLPKLPGIGNIGGSRGGTGGGTSLLARVGLAGGGLLIVLIIFSIAKSALSGGGNQPLLISVAQHQQAVISLVEDASQEPSLTLNNKNFVATADLSLGSSQADLTAYLGKVGVKKIGPKVLNLKVDPKAADQLTAAAAADSYNSTFQDLMKSQLTSYQAALQQAYLKTTGPTGRQLLNDQFKQAQLLQDQLATPSAT